MTFLGAGRGEAARGALFGVPLDVTASFRPGSRFGPGAVRAASDVLEEWSLALGEDLADHPFCDLGDVPCPPGNAQAGLRAIAAQVDDVLSTGRIPVAIGGEHLVTLPLVEAVARSFPDVVVLQFDAHADLRDVYEGLALSHATVMRRICERIGPERVYQVGIRSATAEEAGYARAHTRLHPFEVFGPLRRLRAELVGRPVYVTVDIDVVDPAFAPGTGTPEPGGVASAELLAAMGLLRGLRVVGMDVVEVAPAYDASGATAILAAKVVREGILVIC